MAKTLGASAICEQAGGSDGGASGVVLTGADGSWCEVIGQADNGTRQVWESGPAMLWRAVEHGYQLWHHLGQPGWDRFGLTVTGEHQWVWLDSPDSSHTWPLVRAAVE